MYLLIVETLPEKGGGLDAVETFYGPFPTEERATEYLSSFPKDKLLVHVRISPLIVPLSTVVQRIVWVAERRMPKLDGD